MDDLRGRNAILTGGSYGIGPYIARALAAEGVNVALAARSAGELRRVADDVSAAGVRAVAIPTDLTDAAARDALVDRATAELGPIDILVNNASIHHGGRLRTRSAAQIRDVLETNLVAPILLTRRVLDGMLERGRGHLVQITSLAGKVGLPFASLYTASKHGLVGFTHSLQGELKGTGVHASSVCPGFVATDGMWVRFERRIHPAFGLSRPERIARAVVHVIRRPRVEVVVNPLPVRPVIGTWALMPGVGRGLFGLIGVDAFMRGAVRQYEGPDGGNRSAAPI